MGSFCEAPNAPAINTSAKIAKGPEAAGTGRVRGAPAAGDVASALDAALLVGALL